MSEPLSADAREWMRLVFVGLLAEVSGEKFTVTLEVDRWDAHFICASADGIKRYSDNLELERLVNLERLTLCAALVWSSVQVERRRQHEDHH